jgi:3-oxoacyl-[acyl-carrier protein] reductase
MSDSKNTPLEGKVAVVTGSSRGIGKAVAIELAKRGAKVVVNYVHSANDAQNTVEIIETNGGQAIIFQADVASSKQAAEMIQQTIDTYGQLDILVNNAGISIDKLILRLTEDDWDLTQDTNLKGTFNCTKPAVRQMIRQRRGRIINITSISGQMGNAGQTGYSASKAGQIGFTKALAREVASRNITVNAIAAGYIETDIWNNVPEEFKQSTLGMIPLGRKGTPEEIAYAVAFLASDEAEYITGQCLAVDGGLAMF